MLDEQRMLDAFEQTLRALENLMSGNIMGARARLGEARHQVRAMQETADRRPGKRVENDAASGD